MKNITLAIFENEAAYGMRLAEYIGGHAQSPFKVQLYLEHPVLRPQKDSWDIALVTSSLWGKYREMFNGVPVLVLDEDGSVNVDDSVCKYQSAENIYHSLIDFSIDRGGKRISYEGPAGKKFDIELLFMPAPDDSLKMNMRDWLEQEAGTRKVLYINMEQVPDSPVRGPEDDSDARGFSEIIYYLKQYNGNIGARLSAITVKGKYDYIIPAQIITETYELTEDEWRRLFDALKDETGYELVIFDYGCSIPHIDVLRMCGTIRVCTRGSVRETRLEERFRLILERVGGTELSSRIKDIQC